MNKVISNPFNLYTSLWFLYYLQGSLYESGGAVSKLLLVCLLAISFYYIIRYYNLIHQNRFTKWLWRLVSLFTIYGFLLIAFGHSHVVAFSGVEVPKYVYLKSVYVSLLPIIVFYIISELGYITEDSIKKWVIAFMLLSCVCYFRDQKESIENAIMIGSTADEFTNNSGYLFVACIPALILFKERTLFQFVSLTYLSVFLIMGMKRGAILIGLLMIILMIWDMYKRGTIRRRLFITILSTIVVIAIGIVIGNMLETSEYFKQRLVDTKSGSISHRDMIYYDLWNYFNSKASVLRIIFGGGADSTLDITFNYAHNDWLEILTNQGIIGISFFILFWINFYKYIKEIRPVGDSYIVLLMAFVFMFTRTFFSMSYTDVPICLSLTIGYYISNTKLYEYVKN